MSRAGGPLPAEAAYRRDGDAFSPLAPARSGWDARLQNGSAVGGLAARELGATLTEGGFALTRITLDLFRPVPFAPLAVRVVPLREGGRLRLADATIYAGEHAVGRATGLALAEADRPAHADEAAALPRAFETLGWSSLIPDLEVPRSSPPFQWYCDTRWETPIDQVAPTAWVRVPFPIVAGDAPGGAAAMMAVADLLAALAWSRQKRLESTLVPYVNADIDLRVYRAPVGDSFALRLADLRGARGRGVAEAALFDTRGRLGRLGQTRVAHEKRA